MMDFAQLFKQGSNLLSDPMNLGPLDRGHYIQVGIGTGFYVPEDDFQTLQARANETHTVQFLGVTKAGAPILGTREEIHANPESAGLVAWIMPRHEN
jgi:hypothetical protein